MSDIFTIMQQYHSICDIICSSKKSAWTHLTMLGTIVAQKPTVRVSLTNAKRELGSSLLTLNSNVESTYSKQLRSARQHIAWVINNVAKSLSNVVLVLTHRYVELHNCVRPVRSGVPHINNKSNTLKRSCWWPAVWECNCLKDKINMLMQWCQGISQSFIDSVAVYVDKLDQYITC